MGRRAGATVSATSNMPSSSSSKPTTKSASSKRSAVAAKNNNNMSSKNHPAPILSPKSNTIHYMDKNPLTIHSSDVSDDESEHDESDQEDQRSKLQSTPVKNRVNGQSSPVKKSSKAKGKGKQAHESSNKMKVARKDRGIAAQETDEEHRHVPPGPSMPEEQIQAVLAALDLECKARLSRLEGQYQIAIASVQMRQNTLFKKMPNKVRDMTVGEFIDLYDADTDRVVIDGVQKADELPRNHHETQINKRRLNMVENGEQEVDENETERKGKAARLGKTPTASGSSKQKTKAAAAPTRKGSSAAASRNRSQQSKASNVASSSGPRPPSIAKFNPNLPANLPRPPERAVLCKQLPDGTFVPIEEDEEMDEGGDVSIYEEASSEVGNSGMNSSISKKGSISNIRNHNRITSSQSSSSSSRPSSRIGGQIPFPSTSDDDDEDELPDEDALTQAILRDEMAKVALNSSSSGTSGSNRNGRNQADGKGGNLTRSKSSSTVSRPPVAGGAGMKGKMTGSKSTTKKRDSIVLRNGEELDLATATREDLARLSPKSKKEAAAAAQRYHEDRMKMFREI